MNFSDFYHGKKVLVTGHTGFKGSWLTEWLLMMGAKVTGFALPPATVPSLFDQLGLADRCDHRLGDVRDRVLVRKIIHDVRPDLVFHLAAQPLVRLSYEQPVDTYETNVMGTVHILDALRDADWKCAAVMITTDKVYENREWLYAYRESDPLGGYDPYSSSKACAELVIQSYRNSFFNPRKILAAVANSSAAQQLNNPVPCIGVASARAGNVIGGGDWAKDRIMPDCMRALAGGEVVKIRNPRATRPWQHVLEPLSGYLLLGCKLHGALTTDVSNLVSFASAFNFGPPLSSNRPVRELVEAVLKRRPGHMEEVDDITAPHEAKLLNLAADKAYHLLGWRPCWSFDELVDKTVELYSALMGGASCGREVIRSQIGDFEQAMGRYG